MRLKRLLLHGVAVQHHRWQIGSRALGLDGQCIGIDGLNAKLIDRHLTGDDIIPVLDHAVEEPGEVPAMFGIAA